ncbi:sensor histidine kinase [Actinocrispum wychmicini]|uniref:histidine kinase n=1 Tax=Actinocrispum wychmicini TaxID=1213861 RepID=A0A4R2JMF3_9PSEU|nr:sensor histidine kinase [Actinocrispum wychmicini]TCO60454.1 signal transduction histidine kinase [Actinocrispum wychmicini]
MRRHLPDISVVLVVAAVGLIGVVVECRDSSRSLPPLAGAVALAAVGGALLPLRKRWPLWVALGVLAVCLTYHLLGYPGLAVAAPMYLVCYTLVGNSRSHRALGVGVAVAFAVPLISLLPPHPPDGVNFAAISGVTISLAAMLTAADAKRAWSLASEEKLRRITQESDRRVVAERLTIARELHDVLAHTITLISVQAAAGLDAMDTRPAQTRSALTNIRVAAKDAMAELRSTLRVLRDSATTDQPAPQPRLDQVAQLVDQATGAGIQVSLVDEGDPVDIPIGVELAAYRIVQEALTNVIRHANATQATVRLRYYPDSLLVEVTDNGQGPPDGGADGHGMIGMRERARATGGTFEAGPAPDHGFVVRANLTLGEPR